MGVPLIRYSRGILSDKAVADLETENNISINFENSHEIGIDKNDDSLPIVSLTSFGERIHTTHLTIQSIFEQSVKPKIIILWLDKGEFSIESIPESLKKCIKRGLKIGFCENLYSYKKIVPSLIQYPNDIIVTIDDDVLYPASFIEGLLKAHKVSKRSICCYRAHRITKNEYNEIKPYLDWDKNVFFETPRMDLIPTGVGGVLYPPHCLNKDTIDDSLFLKLCPTADDIWLKVMSLLSDTPCQIVYSEDNWSDLPPFIHGTQDDCLAKKNVKAANDQQLDRTLNHFDLTNKLIAYLEN
jgi:hypothetical protein